MTTNNGGPAFPARPTEHLHGGGSITAHHGMSLRDYAAIKVIARCEGNPNLPDDPASPHGWPEPQELALRRAKWGILQADAFLAAREATE